MVRNILADKNNRVQYIDISRALAIFLVVLGHVLTDNMLRQSVYSFHMPLFFIISGMTIAVDKKRNIRSYGLFLVERARSYLIPYFIWAFLYSGIQTEHVIQMILYGTRESLRAVHSLTSLWFLPVLMLAVSLTEGMMLFINNLKNKDFYILIAAVIFFTIGFSLPVKGIYGYPWGGNIAFCASGFMFVGYFLRKMIEKVPDTWSAKMISFVVAIFAFILIYFYAPPTVETVYMYKAWYGKPLVFLLNAVAGSVMVLMGSYLLESVPMCKHFLTVIGRNTLGILVLHKILIKPIRQFVEKVFGPNASMIDGAVLVSVAVFTVSFALTLIIASILPEIVGKRKRLYGD